MSKTGELAFLRDTWTIWNQGTQIYNMQGEILIYSIKYLNNRKICKFSIIIREPKLCKGFANVGVPGYHGS